MSTLRGLFGLGRRPMRTWTGLSAVVLLASGCAGIRAPLTGAESPGHRFLPIEPVIDLAGVWRFRLDPRDEGVALGWAVSRTDTAEWRDIDVPGMWETQGIPASQDGAAWYRRDVLIPASAGGLDLRLNLRRVDDAATVFWNGEEAGATRAIHESTIFTIPAARVRTAEANMLAVRVTDLGGPGGFDGGPVTLVPVTPWSSTRIDIADMPGLYRIPAGQHCDFNITVDNPLPQGYFADLRVVVTPFGGEPLHDSTHGPIWINPHPDYTKPLGVLLGQLPPGWYGVEITLTSGQTTVARRERAFTVTQPVRHLDPEASPFGLNSGALFHLTLASHETEGEARLAMHEATGAPWGRNDLWWGEIETARGEWDWRECDSVVSRYADHDIRLLGILSYFSAWSGGRAPATAAMREEWLEYVRRTVARYGPVTAPDLITWEKGRRGGGFGRVHAWEVWNEPNLAEFWEPEPNVEDYAELLRVTHEAIEQIDPGLTVVGCVTSGVPLRFIRGVLDAGGAGWMDVLSVHPYQGESPVDWREAVPHGQLRLLREELERRGQRAMPIWITEEGWPTTGAVDCATQAEYLVKMHVTVLASGLVDRIFWFNLNDWGAPDDNAGGHFGLCEMDHTPKPSYAAYNNLIARLHDFDRIEDHSDAAAGLHRYVFHRPVGIDHGAERVTVVWSESGEVEVSVPPGARVVDVVGSPVAPAVFGHPAAVRTETAGRMPIYLIEEIAP